MWRIIAVLFALAMASIIGYDKLNREKWREQYDERIASRAKELSAIHMVSITAGSFFMGSEENPDESPVHRVTVCAFRMSVTEITWAQFVYSSGGKVTEIIEDTRPICSISWYDAVRFCNRLSDRDGLARCYDETTWECDFSKNGYRLPTEAEWEYACRAGTTTPYSSGTSEADLDRVGWYANNSKSALNTYPVAEKMPNPWGLYDMHGNVWEWCTDQWGKYGAGNQSDSAAQTSDVARVLRGGACNRPALDCRSATRTYGDPRRGSDFIGFRVVRR